MIVVADAGVLVGELLRRRGRELFLHPALHVVVAEDQWSETEHEPARRLSASWSPRDALRRTEGASWSNQYAP
jgi:hypothetical protein